MTFLGDLPGKWLPNKGVEVNQVEGIACERALRQYIQSLRVSFNSYGLQGYKNIFILIITFILFSINCLSNRCPISRKSRNRNFIFILNNPKLSQEQTEATLVYMVSVSWCHWSTAAVADSGPRSVTEKPHNFLPILFSTIVPKSMTRESLRTGWIYRATSCYDANSPYPHLHSFRIHLSVWVGKHRKMARRINAQYW